MLVGYSCPIQAVGHALQISQWFIPPLASPLSRRNERCSSRAVCTTPSSYIPAALPGLEKSAHTLGTRTEDARVSVAPDRRETQSACHTPGIRSYVLGDVYQRRVTKMKGNKLGHREQWRGNIVRDASCHCRPSLDLFGGRPSQGRQQQ